MVGLKDMFHEIV